MTEFLKEANSTEETKSAQPEPKPKRPRKRANLILAVIAFLASISLVVLGIFLYFDNSNLVAEKVPASVGPDNDINPPPAQDSFGFQSNPDPKPTTPATVSEPTRLKALADDFLIQGRPVEASAQYQLILDKYGKSPEAKAALFGLARSNAEQSHWAEASEAFKKYLSAYPDDSQNRLCYYYLGIANRELGNWSEAINNFQKYQALQPGKMLLDGYASFEIAAAYNKLQQPQKAVEYYQKAAESQVSNLVRANSMEDLGDYFRSQKNYTEALNWYNRVLEVAQVPDYRAGIISKQVQVYIALNQPDKAAGLNRKLLDEYLATSTGFATLKTLFNANSPVLDNYFKGYYLLKAGDPDNAIKELDAFLGRADDKAPQPATPSGMPKDAQNRLASGWFYLAGAYEAKADLARATAEYRGLINQFPLSPSAPQALLKLAQIAENQSQPDTAIGLYSELAQKYPNDASLEDAMYDQAQLALAKGPEAAQPYVDNFAAKFLGSNKRGQLLYTLGRAYQVKGNVAAARANLQKAADSAVVDFYSVRAGERLADAYDPNKPPRSNPATHPAVYSPQVFAGDAARDRKAMDSWLLTWASAQSAAKPTPASTTPVTGQSALDAARQSIVNDPGFKRMVELLAVGSKDQASREARELVDRNSAKPLELYFAALSLSEQGEYYYSVTAAKQLLALYQQKNPSAGVRQAPLLLQKLIYPLPFQPMVLEQSRRFDMDPLLIVSMLKQESSFDPDAGSGAGALGLSQVMPETGKAIAVNLDKPEFSPEDLFRPYTAIEFGTFYLSARLKDFDGNPYEALAGYNGGAGNVYRWSKANDPEKNFDNWVFNIDYPETRTYVQIIYANYYMYRQIYTASSDGIVRD
ncbi:MAG TPA: transglycosylase SLT domain-containing protein [Chloroflexia bacterium]|nr:transglycosylase SLT domain-containing protein [Chloroflexia bacterium]